MKKSELRQLIREQNRESYGSFNDDEHRSKDERSKFLARNSKVNYGFRDYDSDDPRMLGKEEYLSQIQGMSTIEAMIHLIDQGLTEEEAESLVAMLNTDVRDGFVNEGITRADFYKQIEKEAFTAGWDSYEENANVEDAFNRFSSQQDAAQEEPKSYAKGGGSDFIDPMGLRESVNEDSTPSIEDVRLYIQKELGRAGEQDSGLDAYIDSIQRDFAAGRDAYDDYEMDDYLEDFENYIADKMDY